MLKSLKKGLMSMLDLHQRTSVLVNSTLDNGFQNGKLTKMKSKVQ